MTNQLNTVTAKLAQLSMASKLLLGAGLLLFIDSFLDWQQVCVGLGAGGPQVCGGRTGWSGWGVLVGLLVIALLIWEGLQLTGAAKGLNVPATLVTAGLAAAILLFTIIKFFVDDTARHWPAWAGLILAIVIAVGGWLRFKESPPSVAPPPA
jgi:hypothetical protein